MDSTPEETSPVGASPKLFYCNVPHCGKFFNRKEHLTRHVKSSHGAHLHECPVCGRRYGRSDVLKRHLGNHPQNPPRRPRQSPCGACAARKSRCDGGDPCRACSRALTTCVRAAADLSEASSVSSATIALNTPIAATPIAATDSSPESADMLRFLHAVNSPASLPAAPPTADLLDLSPLSPLPDADTLRLVQAFFDEVHPVWPILHRPTFRADQCSSLLLRSMMLLASLVEGSDEHSTMGPMVLSAVFASQLIGDELRVPVQTLQAMLLCIVFCITKAACSTMLFRAVCLNGYLIAACRHQQILAGQHEQPELQDDRGALEAWLAQEERNRLAYACLRMDAYLGILLDHPPSIRYFELTIPLPKLPALWEAASDDERRRLQWAAPAGRERALFCNILRDALEDEDDSSGTGIRRRCSSFSLTQLDHHLGLCALQGGVWEAAGEAHSFATDELSAKPGPGSAIVVWAAHLDYWKRSMEASGLSSYFDEDLSTGDLATRLSPYTLLLWHVAALKMHAPIPLLQASANLQRRLAPAPLSLRNYDLGARIRDWIKTPCARRSCWYAAQITRVVCREKSTAAAAARSPAMSPPAVQHARARLLLLNPLAGHSLFMAAIVLSSYAYYVPACAVCVPAPIILVNLFLAAEDLPALQSWFHTGTGHAVWGPEHVPVCRCSFDVLATWLRGVLAADLALEQAFVAYTDKLRGPGVSI